MPIADLEQIPRAVPDGAGRDLGLGLASRIADDRGEVDKRVEPLARKDDSSPPGRGCRPAEREVGVGEQIEQRLAAEQERVRRDDAVTPGKQPAGHHRTDISGTAGDKNRVKRSFPAPTETRARSRVRILAGGLAAPGDEAHRRRGGRAIVSRIVLRTIEERVTPSVRRTADCAHGHRSPVPGAHAAREARDSELARAPTSGTVVGVVARREARARARSSVRPTGTDVAQGRVANPRVSCR